MRSNIYLVLIFLFSLYCSCAAKEKVEGGRTHHEEYLFSSKDAEKYYRMTADSVRYVCCNTVSLPMATFILDDQLCSGIKENRFDIKSEEIMQSHCLQLYRRRRYRLSQYTDKLIQGQ